MSIVQKLGIHRRSPVGASLLAMAVDQSILTLTDTPLSRASPLPQIFLALSLVARLVKQTGAPIIAAFSSTLTKRRAANSLCGAHRHFSAIEPENFHAQTYPGNGHWPDLVPFHPAGTGCRDPQGQRHS